MFQVLQDDEKYRVHRTYGYLYANALFYTETIVIFHKQIASFRYEVFS